MFRLTVIAAFLLCANGAVLPPIPMQDGRIIGGTLADIKDFPYQVALLMESPSGSYYYSGGGSIISRTVILTAAQCTDGIKPVQLKVRAGSSFQNSGGQVVQAIRIVQHSDFNFRLDYDISLVFLENVLNFGLGVAKVTLPNQGDAVVDGSSGFITGWGNHSERYTQLTQLYKALIPIVNQQRCIDAYAGYNPVTSNMLCAGRLGAEGQNACQGDSGGPFVIDGVLIGITSWGKGCAQAQYPGVWTRVPVFRSWIDSNLQIINSDLYCTLCDITY